jgi:hypothetical protein
MLAIITYGPFRFDDLGVTGPKDYLEQRGLALLDAILSGEDAGYDLGGHPDEETAVLGQLDEDFQLWLGLATTAQVPPGGS